MHTDDLHDRADLLLALCLDQDEQPTWTFRHDAGRVTTLAAKLALLDQVVELDAEPTWTFGDKLAQLKADANV